MKILVALILSIASIAYGQTVTFGNGSKIGTGVAFPFAPVAPPPPPSGLIFTPAAGHQGAPISLNIQYTTLPTANIFYTLDGTAPSIASAQFVSNIPLSIATTVTVVVATVGSINQNTNFSSSHWKPKTINGGDCKTTLTNSSNSTTYGPFGPGGCPTSYTAGGIGNYMPWSWSWSFNGTNGIMNEQITNMQEGSCPGGGVPCISGETQMLYIFNGPGANSATKIAQHKCVEEVDPNNIIANNEMDIEQVDTVHTISGTPVNHNVGLQCNQNGGNSGHWQVNGTGSWNTTGITNGCPISKTSYTCIDYSAHWELNDTGCGGPGCIYLDNLTVRTNCTALGVCSGTTTSTMLGGNGSCTDSSGCQWISGFPNGTVAARLENWASGCGNQDQIDMLHYPNGTLGSQGYTAQRNIGQNNVTCANTIETTGSAAYTF